MIRTIDTFVISGTDRMGICRRYARQRTGRNVRDTAGRYRLDKQKPNWIERTANDTRRQRSSIAESCAQEVSSGPK